MRLQPLYPIELCFFVLTLAIVVTFMVVLRNGLKLSEKIYTLLRLYVIYILVFMISLRPVTIATDYEFTTKNLDVLFVVDSTISMWARDYNGNHPRMDGVKEDVKYVLSELAGSNFGLITFDDTSRVLSPFTQDSQYIADTVDLLTMPNVYYAKGSNLSVPYSDVMALLESSAKKENRKTIVFFISDGELTNQNEVSSYEKLASKVDMGAVLGYGSSDGGLMKYDYGYIYDDETGESAVSRIDEESLKKLAGELDVEYLNMNSGNFGLAGILELIRQQSGTVVETGIGAERYNDTYYYFAIVLLFCLFVEAAYFIRKGRL